MKKFTVSLLTSIALGTASIMGSLSVTADESDISQEVIEGSIVTMEDITEHMEEQGLIGDYDLLSNESNDFLYYDQLDNNNKAIYDAMKKHWQHPDISVITVALPEPFSFSANSSYEAAWSTSTLNEYYNALFECMQSGESAFEFDYPEVFWYDVNNLAFKPVYTTRRNIWTGKYTVTVTKVMMQASVKEIYSDAETAQAYCDYLEECIRNYEIDGDDRYSKLRSIYQSLSAKVTYNIEAPYHDTALGTFLEPYQIVCEGYSETVKLLCDREGIPCISIVGNFDESTRIAHMWNYVQMEDGKWYGLDSTWDDRDGQTPSLTYDYFLKGSDSFLKNHNLNFGYEYARFVYPELSTEDYVYNKTSAETTTITTEPIVTTTISQTTTPTATIVTTKQAVSKTTVPVSTAAPTTTTKVSTTTVSTTTTQETTPSEPEQLLGDFNNDGELTIADAVFLQKKLIGEIKITNFDFTCELNKDGKLNVIDYIILMRLIV